jgi:hypothetical protein
MGSSSVRDVRGGQIWVSMQKDVRCWETRPQKLLPLQPHTVSSWHGVYILQVQVILATLTVYNLRQYMYDYLH